MKLFSFVPGRSSIVVAPFLWTSTMTVLVVVHEIFKIHCPLLHHLWVGTNDGNTFGNAPWYEVRRKILYKDSFNSVISNDWKRPISWELPTCGKVYSVFLTACTKITVKPGLHYSKTTANYDQPTKHRRITNGVWMVIRSVSWNGFSSNAILILEGNMCWVILICQFSDTIHESATRFIRIFLQMQQLIKNEWLFKGKFFTDE